MEEIRPIKAEELEEFNRLVKIAFAAPKEDMINMPVEWTLSPLLPVQARRRGSCPLGPCGQYRPAVLERFADCPLSGPGTRLL